MTLTTLTTNELLLGLNGLLGAERATLARLIAHLVEVEDRRAHLEVACSSLFDFCVRKLGLSEGEAFRRINAARLVRRFPVILEMIASGRIHLSALVMLRDHLDEENHPHLLEDASYKTKAELQKLLAVRFPRPDVPTTIRKLPTLSVDARTTDALSPTTISPVVESLASASGPGANERQSPTLHGGRVPEVVRAMGRAEVAPLSSARYRVQLTVDAALQEKLERAARLLGHRDVQSELAKVIGHALDVLIPSLEKRRFGVTDRPKEPREAKDGYITRSTRREVVVRDGERCTFISSAGERCEARACLELDHRTPRALGGRGDASNVRLLCREHNRYAAEQVFGRDYIAEKIRLRQERREATTSSAAHHHRTAEERSASPTEPRARRRARRRAAETMTAIPVDAQPKR